MSSDFATTIYDSAACEAVNVPLEWGHESVPETVSVTTPAGELVAVEKVLYVYATFATISIGESGKGNTKELN